MPFDASDFRDWISVRYEYLEWREELRRSVLTDELLALPTIIRELQRAFGATMRKRSVVSWRRPRASQPTASLALDGEIDAVWPLEAPDGRPVWVVVEAKARLSCRDVVAWAQQTLIEPARA